MRPGQTVTVSYTPPATNPIQDAAGNAAEGFTNEVVDNQISATAPDAPTNLLATPGDESVTLTWEAPMDFLEAHKEALEEGL